VAAYQGIVGVAAGYHYLEVTKVHYLAKTAGGYQKPKVTP